MGERKGVNKYYPPDWRPEMGSINAYHGTHALRERANKLHLGILIIRFEMPYNIWCEGCKIHIGMGVRYNAEKKKVGMYYTTPVYQFKMKCHLCPNYIEMKTDPGNLDYLIVSGARRQERRWDPLENEQVVPEEKSVSQKLATDAMFKLEHGEKDSAKSKAAAPIIDRLHDHRDRWKDDYSANRLLRDHFRNQKKDLKEKAAADAALLSKSSLDIVLLPQSEEDIKIASLLRLNSRKSAEERQQELRRSIDSRSLFKDETKLKSPIGSFSRSAPVASSLTRQSLGVSIKKGKGHPASCTPKIANLCDYTSSSSEDSS
uniref:EOG090X0DK6 n=1 Tax=Evadne anonyx TaxID=141404 RepID=A0A9N6WQI1_9CRUS|nr:EOG090X0DK6 [Evadne anonyx]